MLEGMYYDKLSEQNISRNLFEDITYKIVFDKQLDIYTRDHFVDLTEDAICIVNDQDIGYYTPEGGLLPLHGGPLKKKISEILEKEDIHSFTYKKAKKLTPALLQVIGIDDFINDMDKRYILDEIEKMLLKQYKLYFD